MTHPVGDMACSHDDQCEFCLPYRQVLKKMGKVLELLTEESWKRDNDAYMATLLDNLMSDCMSLSLIWNEWRHTITLPPVEIGIAVRKLQGELAGIGIHCPLDNDN